MLNAKPKLKTNNIAINLIIHLEKYEIIKDQFSKPEIEEKETCKIKNQIQSLISTTRSTEIHTAGLTKIPEVYIGRKQRIFR